MLGSSTDKYNVTGSAVEVGQTGTVFFPDIAQGTNVVGFVEPTGRLIYTNGVELG